MTRLILFAGAFAIFAVSALAGPPDPASESKIDNFRWIDVKTFKPDEPGKVNTFIKMLILAMGYQITDGETTWAEPYLSKAKECHIVKPGDFDSFESTLKRKDMIRLVSRALKEADELDYNRFAPRIKDISSFPEYRKHILRLFAMGLIGTDAEGNFAGEQACAGKECVEILKRFTDYSFRLNPEPEGKHIPKDFVFPWQSCDEPEQWLNSTSWPVGSPKFSISKDMKTEGAGGLRIDYNVKKNDWYCVTFTPKITEPIDFSHYDGITFSIYNPDPREKEFKFNFTGGKIQKDDKLSLKFRGGQNHIDKGPGWTKFIYYFRPVTYSGPHIYPEQEDALKHVRNLHFQVADNFNKKPTESYIVLDDLRFFTIEKKSASQSAQPGKDGKTALPTQLKTDIESFSTKLTAGDISGAQEILTALIDIAPASTEVSESARKLYLKLGSEARKRLKDTLEARYFFWIVDDKMKAFAIRDIHQQLVAISSDEPPFLSFVLGPVNLDTPYKFTDKDNIVEAADRILEMGADSVKFSLDPSKHKMDNSNAKNLVEVACMPGFRHYFELPFRNYIMWTYPVGSKESKWWQTGEIDSKGQKEEYRQIYDLTAHLLKTYNNTGKTFHLGTWESDFHLLGMDSNPKEPLETRIIGFIEWVNTRQKAVEDARRETPHSNVAVYHYTEVVRYLEAVRGRNRVANSILPYVKVDFVSYSSYESTDAMAIKYLPSLAKSAKESLAYIESMLPPKDIPGKRIFIGEYAYPLMHNSPEQQASRVKELGRAALEYGIPFLMYWQFYDPKNYPMINSKNEKLPVYGVHEKYYSQARSWVDSFQKEKSRMPTQQEFNAEAVKWLE